MTFFEELQTLEIETLKTILKKLNNELKKVSNGTKRVFYSSEYLTYSNIDYVESLNRNFYKILEKTQLKAEKFRNDDKNIEKYQLNHRKEHMQRLAEYITLAYPSVDDEKWEIEYEIALVTKVIKNKG